MSNVNPLRPIRSSGPEPVPKDQIWNDPATQLLEDLPLGITFTNRDGALLYHNAYLHHLLGYARAELAQMNFRSLFCNPEDWSQRQAALHTQDTYGFSCLLRACDGRPIWVRGQGRAICDSAGRFLYYRDCIEDIASPKFQEEEISAHERQWAEAITPLDLALQRMRNAILLMKSEDDWSKVASGLHRELSQLIRYHVAGVTLIDREKNTFQSYDLVTGAGAEQIHLAHYDTLPLSLRQALHLQTPIYRRNRAELTYFEDRVGAEVQSVVDVPFRGGTLAINSLEPEAFSERDIRVLQQFAQVMSEAHLRLEDLRQLASKEEQLRQSQKMEAIGQLSSGIAHNFNNMLQAIIGNIHLSLEDLLLKAETRDSLEDAHRAALKAADMVRQLMFFARRSKHRDLSPLDLRLVARDTIAICRKTLDQRIAIELTHPDESPIIQGNSSQLEQALLNLCVNARDAIETADPSQPRIQLALDHLTIEEGNITPHPSLPSGRYVRLCVTDNGTGMDAATRERLFEPFFTTKEEGRGTGLGLSTVYAIVKDHKGHIFCTSQVGVGTTFSLYLPAIIQHAPSVPVARVPRPLARGTETLLVIDDEDPVRQVVARSLRSVGYTVLESADGRHGLDVLEREDPTVALVLLDLSMPGVSGLYVLDRVRTFKRPPKVIVLTGYAAQQEGWDGVQAVLHKPVTPADLANAVRRVLDQPSRSVLPV